MNIYNTLVKDYGGGRKKIIVYDKGIINLDDNEKEIKKISKLCDDFGCILENDVKNVVNDEIIEENTVNDELSKTLKMLENNNRAKNVIYDLALANNWDWFYTLTFSPEKVDRSNYKECKKKLQKWLNKIKERYCPDLKFLFVPELHEDKINWHFHGLVANSDNLKYELAINPKDNQIIIKKGRVVFNCKNWKYGYSTCTKVSDSQRASNYITKYVTKEMVGRTFGEHRYIPSRNLNRPSVSKFLTDDITINKLNVLTNSLSLMHLFDNKDVIYEKTKNYNYKGMNFNIRYIEVQETNNCFTSATLSEQQIFEN